MPSGSIPQRLRQQRARIVLVAHRAQEAVDGQRTDGGAARIRGGRIRPAVHHGVAHLDAGRVAIEQQPAGLLFQHRHQFCECSQVGRLGNHGRGKLTVKAMQRLDQLGLVSRFDQYCGGAKNPFLEQLAAFQQQADIGLEQLRPGLLAFLRLAPQMLDGLVRMQCRQPLFVAAQGADIEQGLRVFISSIPTILSIADWGSLTGCRRSQRLCQPHPASNRRIAIHYTPILAGRSSDVLTEKPCEMTLLGNPRFSDNRPNVPLRSRSSQAKARRIRASLSSRVTEATLACGVGFLLICSRLDSWN